MHKCGAWDGGLLQLRNQILCVLRGVLFKHHRPSLFAHHILMQKLLDSLRTVPTTTQLGWLPDSYMCQSRQEQVFCASQEKCAALRREQTPNKMKLSLCNFEVLSYSLS